MPPSLWKSIEKSNNTKQFNPPSNGNSGLYIYRDSFVDQALNKDTWVDDKCIGETAADMFFYEEVTGDKEHKISAESEFSPNDLIIKTKAGKNYFIERHIKLGVFVSGAGGELVSDDEGKEAVSTLGLAKKSTYSHMYNNPLFLTLWHNN